MRNSKSLMEVHVADIASTRSRVCKADLSVEVCTIKVNLTAVLVNDFASWLHDPNQGKTPSVRHALRAQLIW